MIHYQSSRLKVLTFINFIFFLHVTPLMSSDLGNNDVIVDIKEESAIPTVNKTVTFSGEPSIESISSDDLDLSSAIDFNKTASLEQKKEEKNNKYHEMSFRVPHGAEVRIIDPTFDEHGNPTEFTDLPGTQEDNYLKKIGNGLCKEIQREKCNEKFQNCFCDVTDSWNAGVPSIRKRIRRRNKKVG